MSDNGATVFAILFIPGFIGMWVLVSRVLSLLGWSQLAERHKAVADPSPQAKRLYWSSMSVGPGLMSVSYSSCINAWIDNDGVYFRPSLMFRLFHPMLFLPWNQMQSVENRPLIIFRRTVLQMHGGTPAISAHGRLGKEILKRWQQLKPQ